MGSPEAIATVLRHCQKMSGFWALLGSKSFKFTRVLINLWAQGEDSVRVLAFLTLMRMTHYSKEVFLERFMKVSFWKSAVLIHRFYVILTVLVFVCKANVYSLRRKQQVHLRQLLASHQLHAALFGWAVYRRHSFVVLPRLSIYQAVGNPSTKCSDSRNWQWIQLEVLQSWSFPYRLFLAVCPFGSFMGRSFIRNC